MSFAATAARRFGHAIPQTSLTATSTVFQPHPTLAAQILGAAFAPPSSRIADFAGSNDADLVSFNATAGLESLLKRPTTASDLVGTSCRTTKRVVISNPESYDSIEIPTSFDLDHPHFEYYQATRMNYDRIKAQSKEYQEYVVEVRNYWLEPENFQMLSLKNQRILKMKWPEFHLTLPEHDDVVDFNIDCKVDRAVWRECQANQLPIEPIVNEEDDLAVEFECDAGIERVTTDNNPSNDAEPIGNEAEEIAEVGLEQEVADVGQTEDALVTPRPKNARMLKELGCTLDGVYWSANGPRIRRKPDRFSPGM
ncbi:hypothetical protein ACHAWO_006297 [Cyclotella atomus]|uniref:Uncharacterized protein n=1 Tax=Cyclotella atomus TaxID=382360 RepID=A0ABD3NVL2_9STRA